LHLISEDLGSSYTGRRVSDSTLIRFSFTSSSARSEMDFYHMQLL
jgi:hypothetical protein